MHEVNHTQFFKVEKNPVPDVQGILKSVHHALTEQGYDPVNQIVGYVMSGDPTYITSYENARSLIMKVERDEIIEELLRNYIKREL
ncbi:MAG: IreB family regulatory phosphoprotein [Lachnospiraceae bacterium]|nr:IreB family regulatory phosphoprotein [Lachnospiraceae bacterium]